MTINLSFRAAGMAQSKDPRYEITWLIRRLFRAFAALADDYLADSGLTAADRAVLEFLYPDLERTVPEIAHLHDVSRQHIQVTVNRLQGLGLVETRPNPRHKRSPKIGLRDTGRATFEEIRGNETRLVEKLFAGLAADDVRITRDTLATLRRRVDDR